MLLYKKHEWKTDSYGFQHRLDANGTIIVPRALEIRETKVYERKTAPLIIDRLVPTEVNLGFGVKAEVFEYSDSFGEAQIASGTNKDIPFADVNVREETDPVIQIRNGYRYSQGEWDALVEASKLQAYGRNTSISTVRQEAALKGLQTKANLIGMYGATNHGLYGFYNNPNVPVVPSTTFDAFAATTAQALLDFYIETLIGNIEDASNLTEQPNVIVQSKALTRKLISQQVQNGAGEGNGVTAFDLIIDNLRKAGTPVTIMSVNESRSTFLEQYGVKTPGTDEERIVVYCRTPECLTRKISPIRTHDWESHLGEYMRIMDQNMRGVRWHYPLSAQYVDIPNAA